MDILVFFLTSDKTDEEKKINQISNTQTKKDITIYAAHSKKIANQLYQ